MPHQVFQINLPLPQRRKKPIKLLRYHYAACTKEITYEAFRMGLKSEI